MEEPSAFRAYAGLTDIVPRPGHKPSGEERAWGRRLVKRFGCEGPLDDRIFVVQGDGSPAAMLDYLPDEAPLESTDLAELFEPVDAARRDCLVAFGWAMAEDLAAATLPE